MKGMDMRLVTAAVLAALVCFSGMRASADEASASKPAEKKTESEVEFAAKVSSKVDLDEATWRELTAKLAKSVEDYNPASVHVLPEEQSLEAFRKYCGKLLESGRSLVALHERWSKASEGLADSLRKAPAYYRAAGQAMRNKAETMRSAVIKDRYLLAADIWDQLTRRAEERSKQLNLDRSSAGVVDILREEVTFVEDFCKTLDALPRVTSGESGRYEEVLDVLRKHAEKSDQLHRQLKLFRDKLKAGPEDRAVSK
jgi:hypothetical protein